MLRGGKEMENENRLKNGLKQMVMQELDALGFKDLIGEIVRESVADVIRSTLTGFDGENNSTGQINLEVPALDEPQVTGVGGLALYLYGVGEGRENTRFGPVGIEEAEVYTVAYDGLLAIVQDCQPEPFESQDDEQVKQWLFIQQKVLDMAMDKFNTVLPMGFNTIIHAEGEHSTQTVKHWLAEESARLRQTFERVRGKDEYGIQVLVDDETLKRSGLDENPAIQKLEQEMEAKPAGARYMFQQRLEKAIEEALEEKCGQCFREVYEAVLAVSDDIKVEKTKKTEDGTHMVSNLSCLVAKEKAEELGRVLAVIDAREGFRLHFTGPWPPYNFMETISIASGGNIKT